MIAVPPIDCTVSGRLVSTNAVDWASYNASTTCAVNAQCSYAGHHYTSLQAANTGNTPSTSPAWWFDEGPMNSLAMFDNSVQTSTTHIGDLIFTLSVGRFTALGLMGLIGQAVTICITVGAEQIYTETRTLQSSNGTFYSFAFDDLLQTGEAGFYGLLSAAEARITITIHSAAQAACGLCVIGRQVYIGEAQYGFGVPLEDRGKHYLDALGNAVNVERGYSKGVSGAITTDRQNFNRLTAFFAAYMGKPILWIAAPGQNDLVAATVFGRYVRAVVVIESATRVTAALDIAGYR